MKKKLLSAVIAVACAAVCAIGFSACGFFNNGGNSGKTEETVIEVENVVLSQTTMTLVLNESNALTATVFPENATDKTVTWSASPKGVIFLENGKMTALEQGTAIITATAGEKSATCTVTVTAAPVSAEEVTLNKTAITLEINGAETLVATVLPEDATDKTVTWISNNPEIASVDNNGNVTAKAAGNAVITAKTANNITAECTVSVKAPIMTDLAGKTFVVCDVINDDGIPDTYFNSIKSQVSTQVVVYNTDGTCDATMTGAKQTSIYEISGDTLTWTVTKMTVGGYDYPAGVGTQSTYTLTDSGFYYVGYTLISNTRYNYTVVFGVQITEED